MLQHSTGQGPTSEGRPIFPWSFAHHGDVFCVVAPGAHPLIVVDTTCGARKAHHTTPPLRADIVLSTVSQRVIGHPVSLCGELFCPNAAVFSLHHVSCVGGRSFRCQGGCAVLVAAVVCEHLRSL